MTALILLLFLVGLALLWLARRLRARSGLPTGRVVAADVGPWRRLDRPLFSRRHGLTGRPDYIVADGADLIPVEVKSARAPARPYASHILQLGRLLPPGRRDLRPTSALRHPPLRRPHVPDSVPRELEEQLMEVLEAMREDLAAGDAPRRHRDPRRCAACGYRDVCEEAL